MPPAGSLKVLHAPAHRGGIRQASQTKIYILETDEFVSNPPFLKTNLAGVISQPTLAGTSRVDLILILKILKLNFKLRTHYKRFLF
jgi:hypothetical protein